MPDSDYFLPAVLPILLDAESGDCPFTVVLTISPGTADIYKDTGGFNIIDPEYVRQFVKIFPPTLHVNAGIAIGTHDIVIDYTDSEGTQ